MKYKVSDKLPEYDAVIIVWGLTHSGPALGMLRKHNPNIGRGEKDYWEVQPWWEVDYWTYEEIDSWQPIEP